MRLATSGAGLGTHLGRIVGDARETTRALTKRAESFFLLSQAVGIVTTSYVDKVTPEGRLVLYVIAAGHVVAAVAAFSGGGPFYRGGGFTWAWVAASLLMPLLVAGMLPIGEYGSSPACVQLCGYPVPPIIFLAFFPWLQADRLRLPLSLLISGIICLMPLAIMAGINRELTEDNWLSWWGATTTYAVAYLAGLLFGAVCRVATGQQLVAQEVAHGKVIKQWHDNVSTSLLAITQHYQRGDHLAVEQQLQTLVESLRADRHDLLVAQPDVWLSEVVSAHVAQIDGLIERIDVPAVGGLAVKRSLGSFLNSALGALLKNVLLHADASRVSIDIRTVDNQLLVLEVTDNGRGFEADVIEGGSSLNELRQRAKDLGGGLRKLDSAEGSSVEVWVPLDGDRFD